MYVIEHRKVRVGDTVRYSADGVAYTVKSILDGKIKGCVVGYSNPMYTLEENKIAIIGNG